MARQHDELPDLVRRIRDRLALERALGLNALILPPDLAPTAPEPSIPPADTGEPMRAAAPARRGQPSARETPPQELSPAAKQKAQALAALEKETANCRQCALCETRTNLVFGVGNPDAELMFIGEAPGADEDRQGEPFVGRAGQLLTRIIIQGMKMRRSDVYIANILKCRPPGNRTPSPTEMALCKPHLLQQIRIIQPKVIVALGAIALRGLTDTNYAITKCRGRFLDWRGTKLMPTFHTAYLLRNPGAKKDVWEDIKKVMKYLAEHKGAGR